jgi:hypothetical protein
MSGYLANLVRRATALQPDIRPRLPSMFDPASALAWDAPAAVSEDGSHADASRAVASHANASRVEGAAPRREDPVSAATGWPADVPARDERPAEEASAPQRPAASPLRRGGVVTPSVRSVAATATTDHPSVRPDDVTTEAVGVPREAPARSAPDDVAGSSALTVQTARPRPQSPARTEADDVVRSNDPAVEPPRSLSTRTTSNAMQDGGRDERSSDVPPPMRAQRAQVPEARDRVEPASPEVAHADSKPDVAEPSQQSSLDRRDQTSGEPAEFEVTSRRRNGSDTGRTRLQATAHPRQDRAARSEAPHDERSPAAQPVVHVTIGRVEVRASMSAEPRQRTRPSTGTTSLDDYLRQRSGRSSP